MNGLNDEKHMHVSTDFHFTAFMLPHLAIFIHIFQVHARGRVQSGRDPSPCIEFGRTLRPAFPCTCP